MDKFAALLTFTKVVEAGGFSAAARQLDVSPATVTAQIMALEKSLKTRLLTRTTRAVSLTDEGEAYYEHASHILESMREAEAMLTSEKASPKGLLRVSLPQLVATRVVFPALPDFLARYPDLRVEFTLGAQAPSFSAQNLDVAIQITADIEPGLVFRPMGLVPLWTAASPDYLAARGVPKDPDDLVANHDILGIRAVPGMPAAARMCFEKDRRLVVRDPKARIVADSGVAGRELALLHLGVVQAHHYGIADLVESGRLVRILQDWEWSGPPIGIVHPPNRFLQPRVTVFVEFVQKLLAGKVSPYRPDWVAPALP